MSKKMEEVRDAGVRVVAEDFLTDIKSSGKALRELISLHGISPWGAEVKLEAQASSTAAKSVKASKSSGRGKEDEGKSRGFPHLDWVLSVTEVSDLNFLHSELKCVRFLCHRPVYIN